MGLFGSLFRRRRRVLDCCSASERGLVRPDNQDHVFINRGRGVFCVADGMGGGEGGAEASRIVCDRLARAVARRTDFPERVSRASEALGRANADIRAFAADAGYRRMASTATVLLVDAEGGRSAVVGAVGDSRLYRFRGGELVQLTRDHTVTAELVRRTGTAQRAATPGFGGRDNALSHVLTRAVGVEAEVRPEWRRLEVRQGDVYLLCTDGLYDMVPSEGIAAALAAGGSAAEVVARLAEAVVKGGAGDNYSMIVVRIGGRR